MQIGVMEVKLYAPFVHSLKEKRTVVKSLISKIKNKFNVSIAETDMQDTHQIIVVTMCTVLPDESVWDNILNFIERNCEAEITNVYREKR